MKFQPAKDSFTALQQRARDKADPTLEQLATGLLQLTETLDREVKAIRKDLETIKQQKK